MCLPPFSGLILFLVVIAAVSYVAPWQSVHNNQQFPTEIAFEEALHAHWIVAFILASALNPAFNATAQRRIAT